MLQLLPQNDILCPEGASAGEIVSKINSFIDNTSCETMSVDISLMNIIDACYVSTLCSTKHFIKYPEGRIKWKISSEIVREFNKDFEMGNCEYIID